jgi:large subunit ribosomal protein L10
MLQWGLNITEVITVALNLDQKKAIVADMVGLASRTLSAVAADYRGLTVAEMTELRKKARAVNVSIRVVRNTLAKRAFAGTALACVSDLLVGPLLMAFAHEAPGAAARLIRDFIKDHEERLTVKVLALDGQLLAADDLGKVAKLPSRDEALAILMAAMKAPMTKCVRTMAEPPAKLVRTFAALRDQKQAA